MACINVSGMHSWDNLFPHCKAPLDHFRPTGERSGGVFFGGKVEHVPQTPVGPPHGRVARQTAREVL
jgi:hypothetical protein